MTSATEFNSPLPELQVADIAQYKKGIESHAIKYGVKGTIKKTIINITDQESYAVRGRPCADYLWRSLYGCHCAGSKRHAIALQRNLQKKKSKNVRYKVCLIATYYFNDPKEMVGNSNLVPGEQSENNANRPDYKADVYQAYKYLRINVYSKIKASKSIMWSQLVNGFCRIATFCKDALG